MLKAIDHLVIVVPELDAAIRSYRGLGFTVTPGGRHPIGTHNALIGLRDGAYIELIAFFEPNAQHRWFRRLQQGGGLIDFCMQTDDLRGDAAALREAGVKIAEPRPLTRVRPDGYTLSWVLSIPEDHAGVAPFLIEDETPRAERVPRATSHPNGATGIGAITVAVTDAASVRRWYESAGGTTVAPIERDDLGAAGIRVAIGPHRLDFVAPRGVESPLAGWLETHGPSPYAATLESASAKGRLDLLFDGLTKFDDDTYQPKPDLAESWTVSKDGREYVFRLRRGVVFHDGSPLTAHDVKWSWEVICHRDNPRIADAYVDHYVQIRGCREFHEGQAAGVDGIEVVDDHTLRVRLSEAYAPFLVSTAVTGILPRARYASIPVKALLQHPLSRAPIGTGPFMYVDWKEGDRLVLKANPRYFLGKPKLDGLVIRFIPDVAARLLEFKNGTLHFAFFSPALAEDFNAARDDPKLVARAYAGVWNYFFAVDHTNPLFKDARVRQALSHALDRPRILAEHWGGYGVIANSPINPSLPAFARKIPPPEYDTAKARRLLAEAGWRPRSDSVLEKDGKRFEFTVTSFAGPSRTMAIVYQDLWKKLGMDVKVETIDFPTLWGVRFHPGKFEALSFLWPSGFYPDPAVGLYPFLCANSRSGYCSAEMDRLIVAGRSAQNPEERLKIYARFQEQFARDLPFMWVVSPADLRLASPRLVLPERQNDFLVMKAIMEWDLKE